MLKVKRDCNRCHRNRNDRGFTKIDSTKMPDLGTNASRLSKKSVTTCCRSGQETGFAIGCKYEN